LVIYRLAIFDWCAVKSIPRQQAADRLADLKVQQANVDAQRARVTAEAAGVSPRADRH
jgi:uncharacterized protein involved in exopolysaccharide biosynthesis